MSLITLQQALDFLDIGTGYFEITAENDILNMSYDGGLATDVELTDGTYEGDDLATELQTQIDAAFTISSTVSYNSSTYKFTITVGAGKTITIDVSASDAALTFGFTSDPTAAQSIVSDQAATEDPTDIVQTILDSVDKWVKNYCQRDFEQTTYTNELYDGNGETSLLLDNYPVISITRLATDRDDAIKIKNTSSDATTAYVSVDSDGVDLVVSGGANEDSSTVDFATYDTMTKVVDQINAVGKGWTAELMDSDYGDLKSTEFLETYAKYCGARAGTTAAWEYLEMAGDPVSEFKVYKKRGEIYYSSGFSEGERNIVISYSAGYASADMPEDLKLAVRILVKNIYQKRNEESFGLEQGSLAYVKRVFEKDIPKEVKEILSRYRKIEV